MVDGRFGAKFASVWVAAFFGGFGYSFLLFAGGWLFIQQPSPSEYIVGAAIYFLALQK